MNHVLAVHDRNKSGAKPRSGCGRARVHLTAALLLGASLLVVGAAVAQEGVEPASPLVKQYTDTGAVTIVTSGPVELRQILRSLSESSSLGLRMASDVQGEVDIHLENVSLDFALASVLAPIGLSYRLDEGVIEVFREGMVTKWFTFDYPVTERKGSGELQIKAGKAGGGSGESSGGSENQSQISSSVIMSVWPDVMNSLAILVFQGAGFSTERDDNSQAVNLADNEGRVLIVNPMASMVNVTADIERVDQVEELLARLSKSLLRQVAIEVKILEVALDQDMQTGIDWSFLAGDDLESSLHTFDSDKHIGNEYLQLIFNNADITGMIEAISMSGELRTVATPRVTTLNNQKAIVRIVREEVFYEAQVEPSIVSNGVGSEAVVNYTARILPVGVVLDVTPQVGPDSVITINIHPTISDVVDVVKSPNEDTAPVLSIRELDTVGKVRHGETLVLAGLISERTKVSKSGIPILMDIPLLGRFFSKTQNQVANIELVVMLTPMIL